MPPQSTGLVRPYVGRCFSASGRALGSAFQLNPDNQDPIDLHPAVAAAPDGSFVATWASGPTESGYQGYNLLARRFAANGQPLGPAFKIVDPTLSYQNYPRRVQKNSAHAYWGDYYPALVAIKRKYDPDGFFRYQQAVSLQEAPAPHSLGPPAAGPIVRESYSD